MFRSFSVAAVCLCLVICTSRAGDGDPVPVLFWNVENFFDYINGGNGGSDAEFCWSGERRWTRKRFNIKCNAIAKAVFWTADRYGRMPGIIGLAEVENSYVLRSLLQNTSLRKKDYAYVHYDSPDHRGIDVALLYDKTQFELEDSKPCRVLEDTRDILLVRLKHMESGKTVCVAVNHHPSKYGGDESSSRRIVALERLRAVSDSVRRLYPEALFVAMGDFNDTPDNEAFKILTNPGPDMEPLVNLMDAAFERGEGTIRFNGRWELIDLFFVPRSINAKAEILRIPFLMEWDNVHAGYKPRRTYSGPRWLGGVSDHCPVALLLPL